MRSPSIAPSTEAIHFVLCDFDKLGLAYVETEPVTTERKVIDDIFHGEYGSPVSVLAVNASEGWARDVSEDIAIAVAEKARAEEATLSHGARNFVERHLDEELEPELCA